MTSVCMIYGAAGFAGRLVLDAALARGLRPVVAGRSEDTVRALAERHQLPFRVFSLTDPAALVSGLEDVDVVLNASGPGPEVTEQFARACIEQGVHYLDIGCGPGVLRKLDTLDEAAREAGVTVVSGAGFSPAVAEALAMQLKRRLPRAVRLIIALCTTTRPSPGLIRSGFETALRPSAALRRGKMKTTPRRRVRRFDFGRGPEPCYRLGWGELAAVHRATGVRNVDFLVRARPDLARLMRLSPVVAALRRLPLVRARLEAFAAAHGAKRPGKPGRSHLAGYAYDPAGQRAVSRIHLPDPYTVTAAVASEALARAAAGPARPGTHTAGQFLGADFLTEIPGLYVDWEELELSAPGERKLRVRRRAKLLQRFAFPPFRKRPRHPEPPEKAPPPPETSMETVITMPPAPSPQTDTGADQSDDRPAVLWRTG